MFSGVAKREHRRKKQQYHVGVDRYIFGGAYDVGHQNGQRAFAPGSGLMDRHSLAEEAPKGIKSP